MAESSHIEWTDATWNPVTGCSKVSPGCKFCYAERLANRLQAMGQQNYRNGFEVTLQPQMLGHPLKWRQARRIFVNSMSDLFHADVPSAYITKVFKVMKRASWHQFQVLTKRSERLLELDPMLEWMPHIWMGVSVENEDYLFRVEHLRKTRAQIKFLSIEPLLGKLTKLNLRGIDWVIVGGESGPGARPVDPEWVREVRSRCALEGVPFFFKQWGGVLKSKTGRTLDGRTWDEMPFQEIRASATAASQAGMGLVR
ncbi:MAG: phage Gp37/Gp68 family protein [Bryobacteraceae bacterium]